MKGALPRRSRLCFVLAGACVALAGASHGQAMHDPTRPPTTAAAPDIESPRGAPVVQTVIITPHSRAAIIDGERVELGGRFREAQVVRITETEVELRDGARSEVLKLYPDVEKTTAKIFERAQPVRSRK